MTTSQKETKDFENYILHLALLSKGKILSRDEGIKIIKSNEKFKKIKDEHVLSVIDTVIHLNTKFNKTWTEGYNANSVAKPEPSYGENTAKADIVLKSGEESFGFSIKMDTDFVISSAQNNEEFEGIFFSSFAKYEKDNPNVDTSSLNSYVKSISDIIGKVVDRHMNSYHFDKKKDGIHDEWIDRLSEEIIKNNNVIEDENTNVRTSTKIKINEFENEIKKFPNLINYIVYEGLTSNIKYSGKLPSANYVLCPTGCYDVSNPFTKYVTSVAEVAKIGVRGMCHGKMRTSATAALKAYWNTETDMKEVYNSVNKMDMSLKWDVNRNSLMSILLTTEEEKRKRKDIFGLDENNSYENLKRASQLIAEYEHWKRLIAKKEKILYSANTTSSGTLHEFL